MCIHNVFTAMADYSPTWLIHLMWPPICTHMCTHTVHACTSVHTWLCIHTYTDAHTYTLSEYITSYIHLYVYTQTACVWHTHICSYSYLFSHPSIADSSILGICYLVSHWKHNLHTCMDSGGYYRKWLEHAS